MIVNRGKELINNIMDIKNSIILIWYKHYSVHSCKLSPESVTLDGNNEMKRRKKKLNNHSPY